VTLILLGPDGQPIHRVECPECEGIGAVAATPRWVECATCDEHGAVRVPGCGCGMCERERADDVVAVVP
jgi:hypothetical protein